MWRESSGGERWWREYRELRLCVVGAELQVYDDLVVKVCARPGGRGMAN